jgi:hypothetical protein
VAINWYDVVKWCNARSEKEGFSPVYETGGGVYRSGDSIPTQASADGYRLPTVEEWQFLARGCQSGLRFPWGNTITHSNANYYSVESSYDLSPTRGYHPDYDSNWPGTSPVGAFEANGLGLFDMAGNVWEWCWDATSEGRYMVGGSWQDAADSARCGATLGDAPGNSRFNAGFRTVRSASDSLEYVGALALDTRDYQLTVSSPRGNPQPAHGIHLYPWRATVTCSVDQAMTISGLPYLSTGWSGTGSVPASGATNYTRAIVLNDLTSSITWNWATDYEKDSDSDSMPDYWELDYFASITNGIPTLDSDGDGQSNLGEFVGGSNPTNAASKFVFTTHQIQNNGSTLLVLNWNALSNRIYSVEASTNLLSGFSTLEENLPYPQNAYTNSTATPATFFRVKVRLP